MAFFKQQFIYLNINILMITSKDKKRFEKKIIKTENCHFWTASKTKQGYGMFSFNGKSIPAHRFSFMLNKGEIDKNFIIHQTCNNTYCVNPDHLILKEKSEIRKNFYIIRINKEMIFKESIRYLEKIKKIRPDLKDDAENMIEKIKNSYNVLQLDFEN